MTKYVLQLDVYTTTFYGFHMLSKFSYAFKSVSEIRYICPVIVVGAVIMHNMFETETKHLSATDGQLKVFLGPCG